MLADNSSEVIALVVARASRKLTVSAKNPRADPSVPSLPRTQTGVLFVPPETDVFGRLRIRFQREQLCLLQASVVAAGSRNYRWRPLAPPSPDADFAPHRK